MKLVVLAAIVLALLWRPRRKPDRARAVARPYFEGDDGVLPVDPYTWPMA